MPAAPSPRKQYEIFITISVSDRGTQSWSPIVSLLFFPSRMEVPAIDLTLQRSSFSLSLPCRILSIHRLWKCRTLYMQTHTNPRNCSYSETRVVIWFQGNPECPTPVHESMNFAKSSCMRILSFLLKFGKYTLTLSPLNLKKVYTFNENYFRTPEKML